MHGRNDGQIKIIFFGLGSIGQKHARIIKNNYKFDIYAYRTEKGQEKNNLQIKEFNNLEDAFSIKPDVAFITNPTNLHIETAMECIKRDIPIFIEKPISNSLDDTDFVEKEIKKRKIFSYVAYNMRFHPVLKNLKDIVSKDGKPIYFRAICSSYLPNWRNNQDYTKSYSAKKEMGGGVILELSHEFDYISWLFGEIKKIEGVYGHISNLKIKSEDFLNAEIACKTGIIGNLHLDCFSQKNERKIQIYYNDKYLEGDLLKHKITIIKKGKENVINLSSEDDYTYKNQIEYFINNYFKRNFNIMNNYPEALKTFKKIIDFKERNAF
jgi:predicted dehydrogenase